MALDAFTGVYTAQQIVRMAEYRANNPGLHLTPNEIEPDGTPGNTILDAPAYAELQAILDHLATVKTLPFTRMAVSMSITGVSSPLPTIATYGASFWRIGFSDPAFLIDNTTGERARFQIRDVENFHSLVDPGNLSGTPEIGYVNKQQGTLIVSPTPDKAYTLEIHFYPWQSQMTDKTSKPWFPYSKYLVEALLCELYLTADDTRLQAAMAKKRELWAEIAGSQGDERSHGGARLGLDPQYYRTPVSF